MELLSGWRSGPSSGRVSASRSVGLAGKANLSPSFRSRSTPAFASGKSRFGQRLSSSHFTAAFLATAGGLGLAGAVALAAVGPGVEVWGAWAGDMLSQWRVAGCVVLLALLPTVLGFHGMNTYQPLVSPSRAALIYLLEPVFTSVLSVWWGFEEVTAALLLGGGLIVAGNLLVEAPGWVAARARPPRQPDASASQDEAPR